MRTKALILTAAVGAMTVATSMAQVYSVNAVGYANLNIPTGFSIITHQFVTSDRSLSALIPNPLPTTRVYFFSQVGGYSIKTFDDLDLIWLPDGTTPMALGSAVFVESPAPQTFTFLGEVPQGTLNTPTPTGFNLVGSQVPQSGLVSALGLVGEPNDRIYRLVSGSYQISTFDDLDLVWLPAEPNVNVGEGFFLEKANTSSTLTWSRTFTVN
jgi:hypothetical protein